MADRKPPSKSRKRGARPPKTDAAEWPVTEAEIEALGDAALEEAPLDPLEELVQGGADPDEGFAASAAIARKRSAQLAAGAPDVKQLMCARRKKAFLMALAQTGIVTMACAAAGWPRNVAYSLRKGDEEFAQQWAYAVENAADVLEIAALQRAVHGVQEDIWHKPKEGEPMVIGQKTIYSDRLLETLMKGANPKKFNPGAVDKGGEGGAIGGVLVLPAAPESIEDFEAAAYRQQAQYRERREEE